MLLAGYYDPIFFIFVSAITFLLPVLLKYRTKPERSIYAYLILWITFPKHIRSIPLIGIYDFPGYSYFDVLQTIATLHIVILLIIKGYGDAKSIQMPKKIKELTIYFIATLVLTTISGVLRYLFFVSQEDQLPVGSLLDNAFMPYTGVIFFLGLFAFILDYKQVEKLLGILALSGVLLLIEHLLMVKLQLFSSLNQWAFASDDIRFSSLIYGSYDIKGIFCVISTFAILYFAIEKKKYYILPLAFLMIFPIYATFQRTPYLGYFFGLITFISIYMKKKHLIVKFMFFFIVLFSALFISINSKSILKSTNDFITEDGMAREGDINDDQSFYDRLGLWYRAADVFIYYFPLGVGEGMFEVYSGSTLTPNIISSLVVQKSQSGYESSSGFYRTKPHNVYIEFISEYNILGFIVLLLFIKEILKYLWGTGLKNLYAVNNLFRASVISMIVGLGIMNLFDSVFRLYFVYGLLMFFVYFVSKSGNTRHSTNSGSRNANGNS